MCVCIYIYRYEDGPKRVKVISVSFLIIFGRFLGNESHCGMISNFFNGPGRSQTPSPWYRWPIGFNDLPFLKTGDSP